MPIRGVQFCLDPRVDFVDLQIKWRTLSQLMANVCRLMANGIGRLMAKIGGRPSCRTVPRRPFEDDSQGLAKAE